MARSDREGMNLLLSSNTITEPGTNAMHIDTPTRCVGIIPGAILEDEESKKSDT